MNEQILEQILFIYKDSKGYYLYIPKQNGNGQETGVNITWIDYVSCAELFGKDNHVILVPFYEDTSLNIYFLMSEGLYNAPEVNLDYQFYFGNQDFETSFTVHFEYYQKANEQQTITDEFLYCGDKELYIEIPDSNDVNQNDITEETLTLKDYENIYFTEISVARYNNDKYFIGSTSFGVSYEEDNINKNKIFLYIKSEDGREFQDTFELTIYKLEERTGVLESVGFSGVSTSPNVFIYSSFTSDENLTNLDFYNENSIGIKKDFLPNDFVPIEIKCYLLGSKNKLIKQLEGEALINLGRETTSEASADKNYGIAINSSDDYLALPPRAISLFQTKIHPNESIKVSYDYQGILGTLPKASQLGKSKVSYIYENFMEDTQGIFTDNMYIGDERQYMAFYTDARGKKHLTISASDLFFYGENNYIPCNENETVVEPGVNYYIVDETGDFDLVENPMGNPYANHYYRYEPQTYNDFIQDTMLKYIWQSFEGDEAGLHMASGLMNDKDGTSFNRADAITYGYNSLLNTTSLKFRYNNIDLISMGNIDLPDKGTTASDVGLIIYNPILENNLVTNSIPSITIDANDGLRFWNFIKKNTEIDETIYYEAGRFSREGIFLGYDDKRLELEDNKEYRYVKITADEGLSVYHKFLIENSIENLNNESDEELNNNLNVNVESEEEIYENKIASFGENIVFNRPFKIMSSDEKVGINFYHNTKGDPPDITKEALLIPNDLVIYSTTLMIGETDVGTEIGLINTDLEYHTNEIGSLRNTSTELKDRIDNITTGKIIIDPSVPHIVIGNIDDQLSSTMNQQEVGATKLRIKNIYTTTNDQSQQITTLQEYLWEVRSNGHMSLRKL